MKKVLLLVCVIVAFMLVSLGNPNATSYTKDDLIIAEKDGYREGFEEGYDLAKHEAKGEIEKYEYYMDSAYEAGYEEGYDDCLEEHGLVEGYAYDPDDPPRIKKDK